MAAAGLLDPDEALATLLRADVRVSQETVPLSQALGRVLADRVAAPMASPPFSKSAMDGWAIRRDDPSWTFRVVGSVAAGETPSRPVGRGECMKIMTGAMLPEGADKVVRVEYTREEDGVVTLQQYEPGDNVITRGSLTAEGDLLLEPKRLRAVDLGVLAAFGISSVPVAKPPRVGVIVTGSELVEPGEQLEGGQIYNSNGEQLRAHLGNHAFPVKYFGSRRDHPQALRDAAEAALSECDCVLFSGGVSMGDYDYVPAVLGELGFETRFHGLELKPGRPTLFAVREGAFAFGLPGNPVSTFVVTELLVLPFLYHCMGISRYPAHLRAELAEEVARTQAERLEYHPAYFQTGYVRPVPYRGSADIGAFGRANALIRIEKGVHVLEVGSVASTLLLE